ncbi:hypothetical protein [Nonomuraea rubra]|uniref:hypothetical protein n=1 Tax=Nonomuraea rubra TaxID=46180 RepID=UPI00360607A4
MHGAHRGDGLFDAGRGLTGLAQPGVVFGQRVRGGGQRDAAMVAAWRDWLTVLDQAGHIGGRHAMTWPNGSTASTKNATGCRPSATRPAWPRPPSKPGWRRSNASWRPCSQFAAAGLVVPPLADVNGWPGVRLPGEAFHAVTRHGGVVILHPTTTSSRSAMPPCRR